MRKGIDVSKHNGTVNWEQAKAAGLQFAMLRCGFGSDQANQDDPQFARNVQECDRLGIPWGAYLYSYALDEGDARSELAHILRLLKGRKPTYPIALDMEDADGYKAKHGMPSKRTLTDIIKTVCSGLERAGYYAMWYANKDWAENKLYAGELSRYDFWYARPGVSKPDKDCAIWQSDFPSTGGKWPGANIGADGGCDTDVSYHDYPAIIKAAGLNGWAKGDAPHPAPSPKAVCTGDGVRIRAEARTSGKILGAANKGDALELLADDGWGWSQVRCKGLTGWMSNRYISVPRSAYKQARIDGTGVRVRAGMSTSSAILRQLQKGQKVTVVSINRSATGRWLDIGNGYVYYDKSYIKLPA